MNEISLKYYSKDSFKGSVYKNNIKMLKDINFKKNDVFIDIGAHRGEEINFLKSTGCFIHSFDCNPLHIQNLKNIYEKNENIKIIHALVTNTDNEDVKCYWKNTSKGGSMSEEPTKTSSSKEYIYVKTLLLSKYIIDNNIENIKAIKMDVEGSEFKIIEDLIDFGVIDMVPVIFYEDHKQKIKDKQWHVHRKLVINKMKVYKEKFKVWY
jgi:FkbM family methyltransferase